MSEDYMMTSNTRDGYERVTNIAGVKQPTKMCQFCCKATPKEEP